mmetsp:Transcript_21849/g.86725  ORF Transcript_21849/g.86725 Transcript_21849/m.86725 type:complete len:80 (+) Transcript_21849:514-753(+)
MSSAQREPSKPPRFWTHLLQGIAYELECPSHHSRTNLALRALEDCEAQPRRLHSLVRPNDGDPGRSNIHIFELDALTMF